MTLLKRPTTNANVELRGVNPVGGSHVLPLIVVAAILAASAALLVVPDKVYSRVMTWDLFFNLSGAWAIYNGMSLHVDFHDPLGGGSFWLTVLGFWIGGVSVWSFIIGKIVMTGIVFIIATAVTLRRLPPVAASVFILMVSLLCLGPTNTGDLLDDFTFAMSYNLYGWAVVTVLALTMFLAPGRRGGHWLDLASALLLLLILFYLKITYFFAGVGICIVAFAVNPTVRALWRSWVGVPVCVAAIVSGPWNWPYWTDIMAAVGAGAVRSRLLQLLFTFSANVMELSFYLAALAVALAFWRLKWLSLNVLIAIVSLYGASIAILSQNAQQRGLPLCMVAVFLLYRELSDKRSVGDKGPDNYFLGALLVLPVMMCAHTSLSLAVYAKRSLMGLNLYSVESSNLKGFSVHVEPVPAAQFVSGRSEDYSLLTRARSIHGNPPLSQEHYLKTIVEGVALVKDKGREPGGVALLDQVNPFPFALGWRPPSGGNLWYDSSFPWPREEVAFRDVRYVLIPKFPTSQDVFSEAWQIYGAYLGKLFVVEAETESWKLLTRVAR